MKVFSYGGGVQSTAALVLAAQGVIDYPVFLFCNVGDDSEHPDTLKYVHDVAMPYAQQHDIRLIEIQKVLKTGETDTIYQRLTRPKSRSIGIPIRMTNGAPGNRACTFDFKIAVVDKWLRENGYKATGVKVGLGISLDEIQRMKPNTNPATMKWKENVFPLIEEVQKPLTRQDCINIIESARLPIPPKSSCWFCPFHSLQRWQEMRTKEPDLFWKSVELEKFINQRLTALGRDSVWFTDRLQPLEKITTDTEQMELFNEEDWACDSGYCFV